MSEKERMQLIANNITYYRKKANITQKALAEKIGITPSTMTDYMKLRSAPSFTVIQKLADFFQVSKSDIDTTFKESTDQQDLLITEITDKLSQLTPSRKQTVLQLATDELVAQEQEAQSEKDLVAYRVFERLSAGRGESYLEDGDYDVVYYDEDLSHDLASWIWGDSMEPKYLNGEVALIKADGFDYDGAVYAISWAGQTFIKKVYLEDEGYRLVSLNPKYAPLFAHKDEDPRIIGRVIGNFMPFEQ